MLDRDAEIAKIRTILKELDGVSLLQVRRILTVYAKENQENLDAPA